MRKASGKAGPAPAFSDVPVVIDAHRLSRGAAFDAAKAHRPGPWVRRLGCPAPRALNGLARVAHTRH
ncbi:hypothetical protein ALSL_2631 [Aerosticca soli]|uniref:Uncharacterized protein n=1 Tax=Aerosticca soli TaxID=2010829 RepID=A0A2Z6E7Y6_9GAMM|nr:hypothetical protein ALSL_2631 [Aerosticca soli]